MFCSQCGTEMGVEATYCPECGKAMSEPKKVQTQATPYHAPAASPGPVIESRDYSDYSRQSQQYSQPYQSPTVPGYAMPTAHVTDYLVPSILLTVCCCPMLGAFALLYSANAKTRLSYGDVQGAKEDANRAKIALMIGGGLFLLYILIYVVMAVVGLSSTDVIGTMKEFERF